MSKITCYIPIPVSSGELPCRKSVDDEYSENIFALSHDNENILCRYNYVYNVWENKSHWDLKIISWLKETIIDLPDIDYKYTDNRGKFKSKEN